MNAVGIIGMGRMGQAIAAAISRRDGIEARTFTRLHPAQSGQLAGCEVAIEFTTPEAAPGIIRQCLDAGVPLVSGTTGWQESHLESVSQLCRQVGGRFLHASNFSIGMNIVFALNHRLAALMTRYPEFRPQLTEIHHDQKKDIPSGTAYSLLESVFIHHPQYRTFQLNGESGTVAADAIPVTAVREGDVKGFHEVSWRSAGERLFVGHEAYDRGIFADGAILAAAWLISQPPGVYTMRDVIQL